jgi:hypothetical protein
MRRFMGLHIKWKGGIDCPPVTGDIKNNKKQKKEGEENSD